MRRAVLLLLLIVLPFQFCWAAAATYCSHESGSSVTHFGHHAHQHRTDAHSPAKAAKASKATAAAAALDDDCSVCHACAAPAVTPALLVFIVPFAQAAEHEAPEHFVSISQSRLERPDRRIAA